mmetsp:Transcript_20178/g.55648  ORF Transcript_20178/g.55648 Transcript_20178/m.55648 type:complete len:371 (-) Transcript_20178:127-1239(-)
MESVQVSSSSATLRPAVQHPWLRMGSESPWHHAVDVGIGSGDHCEWRWLWTKNPLQDQATDLANVVAYGSRPSGAAAAQSTTAPCSPLQWLRSPGAQALEHRCRLRSKTPVRGRLAGPSAEGHAVFSGTVAKPVHTPALAGTAVCLSPRRRLSRKSPGPKATCCSPHGAATAAVAGVAAGPWRRLRAKSPDPRVRCSAPLAKMPRAPCTPGPPGSRSRSPMHWRATEAATAPPNSLALALIGTPEWRDLCRARGLAGRSSSRRELADRLLAAAVTANFALDKGGGCRCPTAPSTPRPECVIVVDGGLPPADAKLQDQVVATRPSAAVAWHGKAMAPWTEKMASHWMHAAFTGATAVRRTHGMGAARAGGC